MAADLFLQKEPQYDILRLGGLIISLFFQL